ncbi:MAG TPA: hypothetical protein VMG30_10645 [Acidobacteriota bacterium]|nr:hypothetical protein [Acidobacteriota bacterium]
MRYVSQLTIAAVLLAAPLFAQTNANPKTIQEAPDISALMQKIRDLEDRIIAMEGQMRQLKEQQAAAPAVSPAQAKATEPAAISTSAAALPASDLGTAPTNASSPQSIALGGAGGSAAKALNPDISVIGDFIGVAGHNPVQPSPSLQMHESEIGLQAILDPYARGDFFLSFGEEGVNLEEGYITFTSLPAGFVVKAGKMRSDFGKVNTMHNHVLSWVDRPLVTDNLVGGEDGINDAGFSIQRILPAPKGIFLEATGQLFRGDSADVFTASNKSDLSQVVHLRGYKDITDSTNLDLGFSFARGHNDLGSDFLTYLYGIDATLRWKPLRRSIYHSVVLRSEFIWSQRQQVLSDQSAFGFYTSADYQLGRRWFLGGRYDRSDRSRTANETDNGGSLVLTYRPSEFSLVRGQYRFTRYADNVDTHELLMQVQFSLGAHGAHPF